MKLTKALSLILALVMLLSTLALGVTAEEVFATPTGTVLFPHLHQTGPNGSNGYVAPTPAEIPANATTMTALKESGKKSVDYTVENRIFTISSAAEMVIFSELVNAGDDFFMAKVYLNGENGYIDMAGINNFQPIGDLKTVEGVNPTTFFRGTFDGRGQSIKNLVMTSNGGDYTNVALFGCIRGAAIINLVIDASCSFTYTGTSTTARTAGVVAWSASTGMDGHGVNAPEHGDYAVGAYYGYAGDNNYHTSTVSAVITYLVMNVKNCATVNGGTGYAGGIMATTTSWTGYRGMLKNCTQAANVSGRVAGGMLAAAIITPGAGARPYSIIECQVKADTNKTVIISGDVVGAAVAQTNGCNFDLGNYGMYTGVELRQNINGYNYETLGYSYSNVIKVDTSALPTTSTLTTDGSKSAYKIVTADDFIAFANYVNAGNKMQGKTVYLANDIDWPAEKAFVTVGHDAAKATAGSLPNALSAYRNITNYFGGTFDGQGYVLDNVKMNLTTTVAGGIFGLVRGGTVKNVVLGYGCEFTSNVKAAMAPLVGMLYNGQTDSGVVMNCFSGATVTSATNSGAGGLVATTGGATNAFMPVIRNCTNAGKVTGGWQAGGMIVWADRAISVLYCLNVGSVHAAAGNESGAMIGYAGNPGVLAGCQSATQPTWNKPSAQPVDTMVGSRASMLTVQTMNHGPDYAASMADIRYAGYQTKTEGGKVTAVRILAVVDDLSAAKVGFMLSANDVIYEHSTTTVYGSLLAGTQGVAAETILAENLGGKYVVAVTITGIPADATAITVVPFADEAYGAEVSIKLN